MQNKCNKNERGAISLFVLISMLFFLVIVVGVFIYFQNKETAIDSEYSQIKSSYEQDVGREDEIYAEQME